MSKISFVIPCYRSEKTIEKVVDEVTAVCSQMEDTCFEFVLINDGSPDDTFTAILSLCKKYENVCGINLSRNFGQHAALMAGFREVTGDIIICMDDDGQTPAEAIPEFIREINNGSDVVYAHYSNKKHSAFRNFGSHINEMMTRIMLGKPKELAVSSFFAAKRFVIDEVIKYENPYPYIIGLVLRTTKRVKNIEVDHREREVGQSGYTLSKLLGLWFNGFTAFSIQPLRLATLSGVVCALMGFLYGIYTIVKRLLIPDVPMGFSAMMSVMVFMGGVIMLMLGLIGEYIGRIYICMNNSPQYVVREIAGKKDEE